MKIQINTRSHREDMRATAAAVREAASMLGVTPTGDDYRKARRRTSAHRRSEQAAARHRAGIDRATCRNRRIPTRGPVGRITALNRFFGR